MEKEFIPYEQALALKELGFDELCFGVYKWFFNGKKKYIDLYMDSNIYIKNSLCKEKPKYNILSSQSVSAPTFSQAFRWFREKYDLHGITFKNKKNKFYNEGIKTHSYTIMGNYNNVLYNILSNEYKLLFEETELKCLKKLIKIVKNE